MVHKNSTHPTPTHLTQTSLPPLDTDTDPAFIFSLIARITASASFAYLERALSCAPYRTKIIGMGKRPRERKPKRETEGVAQFFDSHECE